MRTGLTLQQTNILSANIKKCHWLFEIDHDNDGSPDYYWSTEAKSYGGQSYTYKIMGFSPLTLSMGSPDHGIIQPTKISIQVSFSGNIIDGLYPSDFEGADITIRLVCAADSHVVFAAGDQISIESGSGSFENPAWEETEIMSWRFKVISSTSVDQVMTLECQDFFTLHLEGDYPNTPLISDLFPADIMKSDNTCVPLAFGTPFFPVRWVIKNLTATYVDADTFTVTGDQTALFTAGQFALAHCGVDGDKSCWVDSSSNPASNCIKIARNINNDPGIIQTITTEIGSTYEVNMWGKMGEEATIHTSFNTSRDWEAGAGWTAMESFTYVATGTTTNFIILIYTSTGTNGAYVDGISVKKVLGGGSYGPELIENGNFESDYSGWTPTNAPTITHEVGTGIPVGTTTVNLTAGSDDLTANLTTVQLDAYVLGSNTPTYTINRARSPREANGKSTYLATDYTFKQDALAGSDGTNYKVVQLICNDVDNDGTNDANGVWGITEKKAYDLPIKFSRSDLDTITSPPDIAEYIFEDWGIPSAEIDDTSKAAAAAIYAARGFTLDIGLWYQEGREKLISKLFAIAGLIPICRDKIYFKVFSATSQFTLEEDLIKPGSFSVNRVAYAHTQEDCGYITWQTSTEPVDQVNKSRMAAKSTTVKNSDTTIEAEWVLDSVKARKAGKMALQRIILQDKIINFTAQAKILVLEPGDMITINPDNYGAEGSSYNCLITKMTIHEGLWVDVECTKFSDTLDDWGDLSEDELTIIDANTDKNYSPVYQGPTDADGAAGNASNVINGAVLIGNDGQFKTNVDPATNGGAIMTNESLTGYNTAGAIRFQVIYSGTDQGDVVIGNYVGNAGVMWDQSAGTFNIKGTLTANSGTIGGWTISATAISGTGITIDSANNRIQVSAGDNYVRISSAGIIGYDTILGQTFKLPTDGSAPEFSSGVIKECEYQVYTSGVMKTAADPSATGGLLINNTSLTTYNSAGAVRFQTVYSGADQGDCTIGDFASSKGVQWDQSAGTFTVKGTLNAGTVGGWTIDASKVYNANAHLNSSGYISFGATPPTSYGNNVGAWLGYDSGAKLSLYADANNYFQWNGSNLVIKTNAATAITIGGGGDISLAGSDTDPGIIRFTGTSYTVEMGGDADGNRFLLRPDTTNVVDLFVGLNGAWWGETDTRFRDIRITGKRSGSFSVGDWEGSVNGASIELDGDANDFGAQVNVTMFHKNDTVTHSYYFIFNDDYDYFGPEYHKVQNLGDSSAAWDDAYADDWNNVADFFFLDHRHDGEQVVQVDDLAVIQGIKPSGQFDPRTGLEIIDDNTLPEWLLSKCKKTGDVLRDPEGKPYLSLKAVDSLLMGAVRQLAAQNAEMAAIITELKFEIEALKKK